MRLPLKAAVAAPADPGYDEGLFVQLHATTWSGCIGILQDNLIKPGVSSYHAYTVGVGYKAEWDRKLQYARGWEVTADHKRIKELLTWFLGSGKHCCGCIFETRVMGTIEHVKSATNTSGTRPGHVITCPGHKKAPQHWLVNALDARPSAIIVDMGWRW